LGGRPSFETSAPRSPQDEAVNGARHSNFNFIKLSRTFHKAGPNRLNRFERGARSCFCVRSQTVEAPVFKQRRKEVPKERRKAPRRVINRMAEFQTGLGALPRTCMITNISDTGARLFTEIVDVPERFTLSVSGEGVTSRHECRVVWRLGGELGVEFVGRRVG
jgi:hypothetical protein